MLVINTEVIIVATCKILDRLINVLAMPSGTSGPRGGTPSAPFSVHPSSVKLFLYRIKLNNEAMRRLNTCDAEI